MHKQCRKESVTQRAVEAWEIYLKGRLIDLVYGKNFTARGMKRALVEFDGYSPAIVVKPIYPEVFRN